MSALASNPVESNPSRVAENYSALEIVKLTPRWQNGLELFFQALKDNGDTILFFPHSTDGETISQLAHYSGKDLYYLLVEGENILGYGLLRGWDEGYQFPSLGIAIHPLARGTGLGRLLIKFLHAIALRRGANKVRLRVLKNNERAISLYRSFGYIFEDDLNQAEYLVGFKNLGKI